LPAEAKGSTTLDVVDHLVLCNPPITEAYNLVLLISRTLRLRLILLPQLLLLLITNLLINLSALAGLVAVQTGRESGVDFVGGFLLGFGSVVVGALGFELETVGYAALVL